MAKFNDIRALAEIHAREVSRSPRDWTSYLDIARIKAQNIMMGFDFAVFLILVEIPIQQFTLFRKRRGTAV